MANTTRIISYTEKHGIVNVRLLLPTNPDILQTMSTLLIGKVIKRDQTNLTKNDKVFQSALVWKLPLDNITWSHISTLIAKDIATISVHAKKRDVQSLRAFAWFIGHSLRRITGRYSASIGPNIVLEDQVTMPIVNHKNDLASLLRIENVMGTMLSGIYAKTPRLYGHVDPTVADTWFCCLKALKHSRELDNIATEAKRNKICDILQNNLPSAYVSPTYIVSTTNTSVTTVPYNEIQPRNYRKSAIKDIERVITDTKLHNMSYDEWWDLTTELVTNTTERHLDVLYPPSPKEKDEIQTYAKIK